MEKTDRVVLVVKNFIDESGKDNPKKRNMDEAISELLTGKIDEKEAIKRIESCM